LITIWQFSRVYRVHRAAEVQYSWLHSKMKETLFFLSLSLSLSLNLSPLGHCRHGTAHGLTPSSFLNLSSVLSFFCSRSFRNPFCIHLERRKWAPCESRPLKIPDFKAIHLGVRIACRHCTPN